MISHRRARSGSATSIGPSKLSNFTLAPLTPTPENAVPPTPGGSFFSSMLSAAQNAANTLSNTVSTTNIGIGAKPKTPVPDQSTQVERTVEVETPATSSPEEESMGEPAVKTLGQGDLSLSQLGIQESKSITSTPQAAKFPEHIMDNRTRSESAPDAPAALNTSTIADDSSTGRPRSLYDSGDRSPPSSLYEGKTGLQRSASIRSAIERRRKRGSTGGTAATSGTATTIGAAIAAANASVAHPNAAGSVPKLTGFAVASKKRNRDFHSLFKSVPDDDYLIEDYSCALQREILAHGRLYVSEGHLCFSSNILGWVTTLVMSFDEIVSVEKRSTALVFKNGLMISTLHAKHIFASFTSRDSTYDLIVNIWKLGHPTLRSSLNGVSIDETGGDKTEKVDALEAADDHSGSGSEVGDGDSEDEDDEDVYDEDEEDENIHETTRSPDATPPDTDLERGVPRKASGAVAINGNSEKPRDGTSSPAGGSDFPGPSTHGPTDCGDVATHFERALADEVIPAPLGKVYNLIFGPASVNFMSKWLTGDQKCTDLQMDDKIGLTQDNKSRLYTYTKPLYAPIGPKQTKCIVTESIEGFDLEKAVNVIVNTQTPDVPSGNVFSVKTKYCLHWAENNATRVIVNCTIEWTGKSWLKGMSRRYFCSCMMDH
ncbi:GRAM domain-containing protein [Xylariales sp. PMI_506]|nr:GRAM domain-containing protein [Xylariales sp. PMI_506]